MIFGYTGNCISITIINVRVFCIIETFPKFSRQSLHTCKIHLFEVTGIQLHPVYVLFYLIALHEKKGSDFYQVGYYTLNTLTINPMSAI